ncbi:hypothetical protein PAAG_12502 [Paracoccidioides lutzii Pb01]|uniref:Uncharacterized protein n=1 Tax=Paracoccidioides lutzii (strain ATCC MYA-826 / Pb01) TaxID=502779 RepID=A0A0A2V385_PARBA|nr:hypothetical protein PAAG_12502 [Paracoccidioides lutzii Pb01]KGQ00837.1 hypothetical protein PAAG_12502 [Paracoccidioides lutzii Pb01]
MDNEKVSPASQLYHRKECATKTPLDYRGIRLYRNEPPESLMQKVMQIITQETDPLSSPSFRS